MIGRSEQDNKNTALPSCKSLKGGLGGAVQSTEQTGCSTKSSFKKRKARKTKLLWWMLEEIKAFPVRQSSTKDQSGKFKQLLFSFYGFKSTM